MSSPRRKEVRGLPPTRFRALSLGIGSLRARLYVIYRAPRTSFLILEMVVAKADNVSSQLSMPLPPSCGLSLPGGGAGWHSRSHPEQLASLVHSSLAPQSLTAQNEQSALSLAEMAEA
jgi:hypothetical protein